MEQRYKLMNQDRLVTNNNKCIKNNYPDGIEGSPGTHGGEFRPGHKRKRNFYQTQER